MAVRDSLTGRFVDFRITPKGDAAEARLPVRVLVPYLAAAGIALGPVLLAGEAENAAGFYLLSVLNGALYVALVGVVLVHHLTETGIDWRRQRVALGLRFGMVAVLVAAALSATWLRGMQSLHYLSTGLGRYQLTSAQFAVAGAGQGHGRAVRYVFDFGRMPEPRDQ
jgi:cellulose synthase (UDP-forming)